VERCGLVATKIDKLSRAERLRVLKANEAAFEHPVLPVSANTGEGLDELWTLIDRLLNNNPNPRPSRPPLPRRKS
jgi:50S ribosomal subunit-associated GTPase HflX